jgi:hypothetical protein
MESWQGHTAFGVAVQDVDWGQIADALLRKHTLEYVPGEADPTDE